LSGPGPVEHEPNELSLGAIALIGFVSVSVSAGLTAWLLNSGSVFDGIPVAVVGAGIATLMARARRRRSN
jgi:hypothetical protein